MSKQTLCDGCRRDMTKDRPVVADVYSPGNVTPVIARISWCFEDKQPRPGNLPDICINCVIDAFAKLDTRVKVRLTNSLLSPLVDLHALVSEIGGVPDEKYAIVTRAAAAIESES